MGYCLDDTTVNMRGTIVGPNNGTGAAWGHFANLPNEVKPFLNVAAAPNAASNAAGWKMSVDVTTQGWVRIIPQNTPAQTDNTIHIDVSWPISTDLCQAPPALQVLKQSLNTNICPSGYTHILDLNECKTALSELDITYDSFYEDIHENADVWTPSGPTGCAWSTSIYSKGGHFNKYGEEARDDQGPICKKAPLIATWDVSGPCRVDGQCVTSPNFPGEYGTDQKCTISENTFIIESFQTEVNYDKLQINGVDYSGDANTADSADRAALPSGAITATQPITWSSDDIHTLNGWKLCVVG